MVVKFEARLKESESRLEESKMWVAKEREASKELEEELIMYKKLWSNRKRLSKSCQAGRVLCQGP